MPVIFNRLPQIAAAAKPAVENALSTAAFSTEALAKVAAPVDTGALMGSIGAAKERELTWRVTASADYAIYVEMGTRRMGAQPYLAPALAQANTTLMRSLRGIV